MTITHKSKPDFFFPLQMWPFLLYKARSKSWHSRGKPGIPQGLRGFSHSALLFKTAHRTVSGKVVADEKIE